MNDDLQMLRTLLAKPGPSREVADRGRRQLQAAICGPVRQRGTGWPGTSLRAHQSRAAWLAAGAGLIAAAVAAAVMVASGAAAPTAPRTSLPAAGSSHSAAVRLSARQILLAAATTAAARPVGSGTYWHVKALEYFPPDKATQETWTRRDGSSWLLDPAGTGVWPEEGPGGFSVGFRQLSFGQLQRLPTGPAALEAWVAEAFKPTNGDAIPPSAVPGDIAVALSSLLYDVPAPPAVRAAAFRALASLPDVKRLGAVNGGQGLLITGPPPPADKFPAGKVPPGAGEIKLVIDPATSQVRSVTNYQGTETIITAEWTNRIPRVVQPPPKKTAPGKTASQG